MLAVGVLLTLIFVIGVLLMLKGIREGADTEKMKKVNAYRWSSFFVKFGGCLAVFSFVMAAALVAGL